MSIDKNLHEETTSSSSSFEQANHSNLSKNISTGTSSLITTSHVRLPSPPPSLSLANSSTPIFGALQKAATLAHTTTAPLLSESTIVQPSSSAMIIPSNSVMLQKRLEFLAPSDDQSISSDDDDEEKQELTSGSISASTLKQEPSEKCTYSGDHHENTMTTANRSKRSDSFLSWFSWLSWSTTNSNQETNSSNGHDGNSSSKFPSGSSETNNSISAPFAFEHRIHIDKDPSSNDTCFLHSSSSTTNTNSLITDISLTVFEQRERIRQLERENELKNEYIHELEKKIREMHEKKLRSREKYHKLKDKYEKLRDFAFGGSVASETSTNSVSPPTLSYLTSRTITMNPKSHNGGVSSTPELDALLEKMQFQED